MDLLRMCPINRVYIVVHVLLIREELFYQLGLRQFGDLSRMKLEPPPPLRTLIEIAVNAEKSTEGSELSKGEIVDVRTPPCVYFLQPNCEQRIVNILMMRREMLAEYFSLDITPLGLVESLPLLLRDYTPNLDHLPSFLMRLGPQVCGATNFLLSANNSLLIG